jgi:hypothetical protein
MKPASVVAQVVLLLSFTSLPLLWFIFSGRTDGVSALIRLDLNSALAILIYTPFLVSIRSTGIVLLTSAFLQLQLPYGLLPRILPLSSVIERIIFHVLMISGVALIAISYFFS